MKKAAQRILTGHRPTGPRHIGHLAGTLLNWANLQDSHECYFLIADLHVLTTDFMHPGQIRANIFEVLADWLAAGIDPQRSRIVLQSAVPEHAQLNLLLGMLVSESRLRRVPTYKEQVQQLHLQPSLGLLSYPVLQAADILLYQAGAVPVGEDQLPHIELAREIARRFNQLYGPLFPEPQAILSSTPRLPGIDNRAMHTSYGNAIYLRDTPDETTRKVMSMYTDPTRIHASDPGRVEGNPLFVYLDTFNPDRDETAAFKQRYQAGKVGDVEIKVRLAEVLNRLLAPLRERRADLIRHPGHLEAVLMDGTRSAATLARETLAETMERMGLSMGRNLHVSELFEDQPENVVRKIYC